MVTRDNKVAMVHHNSNGCLFAVQGTVYNFYPQYGISLCWIDSEHVDRLLSEKVKGCCGTSPNKFKLATDGQVRVYETGHY